MTSSYKTGARGFLTGVIEVDIILRAETPDCESRYQLRSCVTAVIMSSEAALNLSVLELLQALNEKLSLEWIRMREDFLPPISGSISSLETAVSGRLSICLDGCGGGIYRLIGTPQVESLEAKAHDVLKLIPSLRSLLQPVNKLPPEIISRIARHHMHNNFTGTTRPIIPLTHVCWYWRESIISTPENWTLISSRSPSLAAPSLQRAKAAPLDIYLDTAQIEETPGFSELLASHIQNTQSLRLDFSLPIQKLAQMLPNFPQSMPNLRSLSLDGKIEGWDWSMDPFGPIASDLTYLSLMSVPLYPSFMRLRNLTDLTIVHPLFDLHLDTLLDFLEENQSLERIILDIGFSDLSHQSSRRRVAVKNHFQSLTLASSDIRSVNALISSIALQRGVHLTISLNDQTAGSNDVLSLISIARLANPEPPTLMEYNPNESCIRLSGINGSFSFERYFGPDNPFTEFPPLYLSNIRTFYIRRPSERVPFFPSLTFPLPSLPALETLVIEYEINASQSFSALFSTLFSNPSSFPSLKTLAFLDCKPGEDFMEELIQFAFNRKNTTSAWLYRVVIVDSRGELPRFASIDALGEHVSVVDVRIGKKLPEDLA